MSLTGWTYKRKIIIDKDGCVIWTYDPEGIKKLISSGVKIR